MSNDELIRIFIGSEPKTRVPAHVLVYTIKKYTKNPIEVHIMKPGGEKGYWQKPKDLRMGTGFSLFRWMIPQYLDYRGKAIYLDADQIVFHDILDLWTKDEQQPGNSEVWCAYDNDKHFPKKKGMQSSVMLIDCEKASYWKPDWMWDQMRKNVCNYGMFMHQVWGKFPANEIEVAWNQFNKYIPDKTKLLHYTQERNQPWYNIKHKFAITWEKVLIEAIKAGAVPKDELTTAIARFGKPDAGDRRRTFGIHPQYRRVLSAYDS